MGSRSRLSETVAALAVLHGAAVAALVSVHGTSGGDLALLVGYAAAFALLGLVPMYVDLGRHTVGVTLTDAVIVAALFTLPPTGVVITATLGELLVCVARRQPAPKLVYNVSAMAGTSAATALTFDAFGVNDPNEPWAWVAVAVAVMVHAVIGHASLSVVLATAERTSFGRLFLDSLLPSAASTLVSGAAGLATLLLREVHPAAPVVAVPVVAVVVVSIRRLAAQQAEHLRFERLYAASGRASGLQAFEPAMAAVAQEARALTTGAVGVCCAPDRSGRWRGVVVDDEGWRTAPPELVAELRGLLAGDEDAVELDDLDGVLRSVAPTASGAVVARTSPDSGLSAVLASFRELERPDDGDASPQVLAAFAGHAALAVANAGLFEEVEDALQRQVDLGRQKDEFVANVSHELRTPLTSIIGALSTMRRLGDALDAERFARLTDIAERQCDRLKRLIEDLLLVAAADAGTVACVPEPVTVAAFCADLVHEFEGATKGRLSAHVDPATPRELTTDPHRLRQVLSNLVENALKYAPTGPIELRVEPTRGGGIAFAVRDHGPGIRPEDHERVFERFVQLDASSTRAQGGTGLGLSLSRQLATLLGGRLVLDDTPGGGCTFTLALPIAAPGSITPVPRAGTGAGPRLSEALT